MPKERRHLAEGNSGREATEQGVGDQRLAHSRYPTVQEAAGHARATAVVQLARTPVDQVLGSRDGCARRARVEQETRMGGATRESLGRTRGSGLAALEIAGHVGVEDRLMHVAQAQDPHQLAIVHHRDTPKAVAHHDGGSA